MQQLTKNDYEGLTFFSVVIPLYNKTGEIERCIHSVLKQSFREFRVIIVDDGSTDDGVDKVKQFTDPRIELIQQPNGGVAAARNCGIAAAGKWVAFLDADDVWQADHLLNLSRLRKQFPKAEFLFTAYTVKRGRLARRVKLRRGRSLSHVDYLTIPDGKLTPSCTAITRSALNHVGGYREMFGEDVDVWFRLGSLYQTAYSGHATAVWHLDAANRRCDQEDAVVAKYQPGSLLESLGSIAGRGDAQAVSRATEYLKRRERGAIVKALRSGDKQHAMELRDWWRKTFKAEDAGLDRLLALPMSFHRAVGKGLDVVRQVRSLGGYAFYRLGSVLVRWRE